MNIYTTHFRNLISTPFARMVYRCVGFHVFSILFSNTTQDMNKKQVYKNNNRNTLLIYVILVWVEKVPQLRLGYAYYLIARFYKAEKFITLKSYYKLKTPSNNCPIFACVCNEMHTYTRQSQLHCVCTPRYSIKVLMRYSS